MKEKKYWIEQLSLIEHPEGGYYKETYRSIEKLKLETLNIEMSGERSLCTGIYFLLDSHNFSAFHRIKSDEMWHFYEGSSLIVHMIDSSGIYSKQKIGRDLEAGEELQFVVKGGTWFASEVSVSNSYSLVGCTVSFGFDFRDFELANEKLWGQYPQHENLVKRLMH